MESAIIISYITLGVLLFGGLCSLWVYLIHDYKLKNQQLDINKQNISINESQIEKNKIEQINPKAADININLLQYSGTGIHIVRIYNKGKSKAKNVRMGNNTLNNENGIIISSFEDIEGIDSMGHVDFELTCSIQLKSNNSLVLIWDDEMKKDNSKEFSINL